MTTTLKINTHQKDSDGFAPGNARDCDNPECHTCGGTGWVQCHHEDEALHTLHLNNQDGYYVWCKDEHPADDGFVWESCPGRAN